MLDLAEDRLDSFQTLFVYRLHDVRSGGFEVIPTYRSPHVTITFYYEPIEAVARLMAVTHETIENPAYRGMEAQ